VQQLLQWRAVSITYYECAFVALGIQHSMRLRHIVFCGLSGSIKILHISSQADRYPKKCIEYKMSVLIVSTSFV
jgi:hypothetical protein